MPQRPPLFFFLACPGRIGGCSAFSEGLVSGALYLHEGGSLARRRLARVGQFIIIIIIINSFFFLTRFLIVPGGEEAGARSPRPGLPRPHVPWRLTLQYGGGPTSNHHHQPEEEPSFFERTSERVRSRPPRDDPLWCESEGACCVQGGARS